MFEITVNVCVSIYMFWDHVSLIEHLYLYGFSWKFILYIHNCQRSSTLKAQHNKFLFNYCRNLINYYFCTQTSRQYFMAPGLEHNNAILFIRWCSSFFIYCGRIKVFLFLLFVHFLHFPFLFKFFGVCMMLCVSNNNKSKRKEEGGENWLLLLFFVLLFC